MIEFEEAKEELREILIKCVALSSYPCTPALQNKFTAEILRAGNRMVDKIKAGVERRTEVTQRRH